MTDEAEKRYLDIIKKQQDLINTLLGSHAPEVTTEQVNKHSIGFYDEKGFRKYLSAKGRSSNCIDTYARGIELFYRKYKVMNNDTLAEYENEINAKLKPKTVNLRTCGMNAYFEYTGFTGYTFKKIKIQAKSFCDNIITEDQYNKFLLWAKDNSPKAWLIAKVIGNTGVRASELIELKTADLGKGYADIVSKGNKQRRIYFPKKLIEEIKRVCGKVYVIENRYGEQITTRGVDSLLKRAGRKADIPIEVMHAHSFRHFFAKQFLKNKNDVTLLGDLLGHSNISTTAIYTRMTSEEQQKEIERLVNW